MNIALEKTEEYVNGQLRRSYGDAFVRGNNGIRPDMELSAYASTADGIPSYVHLIRLLRFSEDLSTWVAATPNVARRTTAECRRRASSHTFLPKWRPWNRPSPCKNHMSMQRQVASIVLLNVWCIHSLEYLVLHTLRPDH